MNEFVDELSERARVAVDSLRQAESAGEDYLVEVRVGELQSLVRLAEDHGVPLPEAAEALERRGVPTDLELPEGEPSPTGPIVLDLAAHERAADPVPHQGGVAVPDPA